MFKLQTLINRRKYSLSSSIVFIALFFVSLTIACRIDGHILWTITCLVSLFISTLLFAVFAVNDLAYFRSDPYVRTKISSNAYDKCGIKNICYPRSHSDEQKQKIREFIENELKNIKERREDKALVAFFALICSLYSCLVIVFMFGSVDFKYISITITFLSVIYSFLFTRKSRMEILYEDLLTKY